VFRIVFTLYFGFVAAKFALDLIVTITQKIKLKTSLYYMILLIP
jgi:hypothetical protein